MHRLLWLIGSLLFAVSCSAGEAETIMTSSSTTTTGPPSTTAVTTTSLGTTTTTATTTTTTTTAPPTPYGAPAEPRPDPAAPSPHVVDGFDGVGVVTVGAGGAPLYEAPDDEEAFVVAREGLLFSAQQQQGEWIEVFTTCDALAWVKSDDVVAQPPADAATTTGAGFDFAEATIVIDPGHGGSWNIGATSPSGLAEKNVNLDIARRVRDLLSEPRSVDWSTGVILNGTDIPSARWVILTRTGSGDAGDYEAGLFYRSYLANAANAHAMVAIHNNAGWEVRLDSPGSDVYYQSQIPESRRFAKLMVEELRRSFAAFEADWVGAMETGAKSRLSPRDGNPQYYGILRRSQMPTVITEGVYISNPSEADLLATAEFRQAYADAVYRALVRFLTTNDTGDGRDSDPIVWYGDAGSGDARPDCVIPSQDATDATDQ